jgi:hypothetical protein
MLENITNSNKLDDWFYLVPAVLLVDLIVIFLAKYSGKNPSFKVESLDAWYTKFSIAAVASDVLSILIGLMVARFIYTSLGLKNPILFLVILVLFQLLHDIFFYTQVILRLPDGHNQMIDVFKGYANENGAYILLADSAMMIASAVIASFLKLKGGNVTIATLLISLYSLTYVIYTNASFYRS